MTISDLTTHITNKLGKTDAVAVARCKEFLKHRFRMVWERYAWADTKRLRTVTVAAGTQTVTLGAPNDDVAYVMGARWGNERMLEAASLENALMLNGAMLTEQGWTGAFAREAQNASGHAQIRLLKKPDRQEDLLMIVKLKAPTLSDNQEPNLFLANSEQAVQAFAEADMLEYMRQYGKAQAKIGEASSLLASLVDQETAQAGIQVRIIPADSGGYERDDFL